MNLKNDKDITTDIKTLAKTLGFDDIGIAKADDTPSKDQFDFAHKSGLFGPIGYLYDTASLRKDIHTLLPGAKSVIVVLKNYYYSDFPKESENKAKIARYAWGQDYHQWFKKKLKIFSNTLKEKYFSFNNFVYFNDTKPVLERAWAQKAGLGFIGKSTMLISRKYGTWTLIGGIITDACLENDIPIENFCGSCDKCIKACPTNAIIKPHMLDAKKCISTWNIEKALDNLAISYAPRNHNWGFGCDICQEVCPWNKFQKINTEERFLPKEGRVFFNISTFLQDLRGSPLNRPRKPGLMANFLRIRKSLKEPNLKIINHKL